MDQFNFNNWPYSNFEQINLDSILDIVKNTVESVESKQDAPADPGTAGQVLGLDEDLQPVWVDQTGGGGSVLSVNGKSGVVVLDAADVGAKPASYAAPVDSVNGKTGVVVLDAADVGAKPASYAAPVDSVNGKTGAVVLDAADVGAYEKPAGGIPAADLAATVQTSLDKADTALQTVPATYRTAAAQDAIDSDKIDKPSNPATGAFLVWDGSAWTAQTLTTWQGGSY